MNLSEMLKHGGRGVLATASRTGVPNLAIYAVPHVVGEETVAWGMTAGRTHRNLVENPGAAYLYMASGGGERGVRLTLELAEIRDSDPLLGRIRERTREAVSAEAGDSIRYVAYFRVVEVRPLV